MGTAVATKQVAGIAAAPYGRAAKASTDRGRLETHGEGLLAIVYGVADLEAHKAKLEAKDYQLAPLANAGPIEPWYHKLTLRERFAPPVMGSWMTPSQIDYDDDVIRFTDVREAATA